MLKKETIQELGSILKEEFGRELSKKDLEKLAYCLVGYFDLLAKIELRHRFENSPDRLIDTLKDTIDDSEGGN